jgi:hypothetical protein
MIVLDAFSTTKCLRHPRNPKPPRAANDQPVKTPSRTPSYPVIVADLLLIGRWILPSRASLHVEMRA